MNYNQFEKLNTINNIDADKPSIEAIQDILKEFLDVPLTKQTCYEIEATIYNKIQEWFCCGYVDSVVNVRVFAQGNQIFVLPVGYDNFEYWLEEHIIK